MRPQPPPEVMPSVLRRLQPVSTLVSHSAMQVSFPLFRPKLIFRFEQILFKDTALRLTTTLPPDLKVAPTPCLVAALGRTETSKPELGLKASEDPQSSRQHCMFTACDYYAVVNLTSSFPTPQYQLQLALCPPLPGLAEFSTCPHSQCVERLSH